MNVKFAGNTALTIATLVVVGCGPNIDDAVERSAERSRLLHVAVALHQQGNESTGDILRELLELHESPREGLKIVRRSEATGQLGESIILYEHVDSGSLEHSSVPIVAEVWMLDAGYGPTELHAYSVLILYSTGDVSLRGFTKEELLLFLAIEDPKEAARWLKEHGKGM